MDQKETQSATAGPMDGVYLNPEEDEVNILDILLVLLKHKGMIFVMVFFTGVAAVVITLMMTNVYRSEATIAPVGEEGGPSRSMGGIGGLIAQQTGLGGNSSLETLQVVLKSRELTLRIIKKHRLMPILFKDDWDREHGRWQVDPPPTLQDGNKAMQGSLNVKSDIKLGTIGIGFDHEDPKTAQRIVGYYLTELSKRLREEVLRDAGEKMRYFRSELQKISDPLLKEKIYAMLAKQIERATFARAQRYYGFTVLDPPLAPDPNKKVRPKRALICILSVTVSFFLAVFLAFFREFFHRVREEDPERYKEMKRRLRFRR